MASMSLLDLRPTPAWYTVLIDRGASYGAQRYGGYAAPRYLDNLAALAYLQQFPMRSTLLQWNGKAWTKAVNTG